MAHTRMTKARADHHGKVRHMLVVSRKLGERLVVPDCNLVVSILGTEGNHVRLGISAPKALAVYREEVWQRLRGESREAAFEK